MWITNLIKVNTVLIKMVSLFAVFIFLYFSANTIELPLLIFASIGLFYVCCIVIHFIYSIDWFFFDCKLNQLHINAHMSAEYKNSFISISNYREEIINNRDVKIKNYLHNLLIVMFVTGFVWKVIDTFENM